MATLPKFGSGDPNAVGGAVFGTFGVQYKPEEFERAREDGFTVMGMVPDCRVFIYGAEVTKDVIDVAVTNSIDGNICDITLTNPRGRYEITKQDLMGRWREDKDILAAYDYTQFNRVTPGMFDNFMDKITSAAFGKKGATAIKQGMNIAKSVNALLGGSGNVPKVRGVTRQIFETKYFSGISKHNGDVVFDFKDPVYVFFKGRFAPLWYFGFSGIIVGWDDTDAYEQTYSIKLKCEDITSLWKRSKMVEQGAMFAFSRQEDRNKSTQIGSAYNPTDLAATFNFADIIKVAVYSFDYGLAVNNCHESNPGIYMSPDTGEAAEREASKAGGDNYSNSSEYKKKLTRLQKEAFIDGGIATIGGSSFRYMFTRASGGWGIGVSGQASYGGATKNLSGGIGNTNTSKNSGLIPISAITYLYKDVFKGVTSYKLNESPLGPSAPIYMQYNELEFPKNISFNGANLKAMLDVSVRYWEAEQSIAPSLNADASNITGTGWKDNKAFGIAGVHPALTYDFINNFSILNTIWQQCYTSKKDIDKVIMTPNDKIRSTVGGMPTELVGNDRIQDAKINPIGTGFNFFRPRLFVVLPRRFSDRYKRAGDGQFAKFENLFKQSATSVYEFLKEKLKGAEYIMYASPAGDVFVEPELYDFHPLEFSQKIESKNIITKSIPVRVRSYSGEQNLPAFRQDKAYMFNSIVNHPFFIMEKDRIRTSQTFDHKLVHTVVTVRGGATAMAGITEILDDQTREMITAIASAEQSRGYRMVDAFSSGVYIADGFQNNMGPTGAVALAKNKMDSQQSLLNKVAFDAMLKQNGPTTVQTMATIYGTFMMKSSDKIPFYSLFESQAIRIKKLLKGDSNKVEGTVANQRDATVILKNEFPSLSSYPSKRINEILKLVYSKNRSDSSKEYEGTIKNSVVMEQLKVSADVYNTVSRLLGSSSYDPKDNSLSTARDIIRLGLPSVMDDATVKKVATELKILTDDYNKKSGYNQGVLIRTIAEEKIAAQLGIYDPRTDMVKHYGYNPKGELKNLFIKSGPEAYDYARTVFNRLKGKAFQISMDIIGRPEFMLNRPYYCERKDSIGLLTKYTVKYQFGSSFLSTATLEYIRKNSIGYAYSLGELDIFNGSTNNSYFKTQADYYYKYNQFATNFASRTTDSLIGGIAGSNPGFGRALGAKVAGNVASSIMGSVLPAGGIFSMHDRIGHIPFDSRFGETGLSVSKASALAISGSLNDDNTIDTVNYASLCTMAGQIHDALANRTVNETRKKKLEEAAAVAVKDIQNDTATIHQLNTQLETTKEKDARSTLTKQIENLTNNLNIKNSHAESLITDAESADRAITNANILLYGVPQKPNNITEAVIRTYKSLNYSDQDVTQKYKGDIEYSQGLFYQLFDSHLSGISGANSVPDDYALTEDKPIKAKFPKFGEIDYYVIRKSVPAHKSGSAGSFDARDTIVPGSGNNFPWQG